MGIAGTAIAATDDSLLGGGGGAVGPGGVPIGGGRDPDDHEDFGEELHGSYRTMRLTLVGARDLAPKSRDNATSSPYCLIT